jgi:hypothetical protein
MAATCRRTSAGNVAIVLLISFSISCFTLGSVPGGQAFAGMGIYRLDTSDIPNYVSLWDRGIHPYAEFQYEYFLLLATLVIISGREPTVVRGY